MSPILGIYASQMSGHLWSPSASYDSIATVTVGSGGSSSITFSSIPSTYTHLQLRISGLAGSADGKFYLNSDTTDSNYYMHLLAGNGTSAYAGAANSPYLDEGATNTSAPAVYVIDILDYTSTNKYKTIKNLWGYDYNANNTTGRVGVHSFLWSNTAAVNTITLANRTWSSGSNFALYGVK